MRPKIEGAREMLLEAGAPMLVEKGYKNLKIQDVANAAGVSAGTFYSYFDDKRSFAATIVRDRWNAVVENARIAVSQNKSLHDRMKQIYEAIEAFELEFQAIMIQAGEDNHMEQETVIDDMNPIMSKLISDALERGEVEIRKADITYISELLLNNLIMLGRSRHYTFEDFYEVFCGITGGHSYDYDDKKLLNLILENTQTKIFWKDTNRRFLGVNKAFLDYYGFKSPNSVIGKTDEDLGWHSDPGPFKNDELCVLSGQSISGVHGKCIARGEERDIIATKNPIYSNGEIVGLVGSFDDVTNEYRQKDEVGRLTRTLNAIPVGIAIYSKKFDDFCCVSINDYLLNILGGNREDFVGKSGAELSSMILHPDDVGRMRENDHRIYTSNNSIIGTYRYHRIGRHEYKWLQVEGRVVRMPNDEELAYYSYIDVDELESIRASEAMTRVLYEFAVNAANLFLWSYDINTGSISFENNDYTIRRRKEMKLPAVISDAPDYVRKRIINEDRPIFEDMLQKVNDGQTNASCEIRLRPSPDQRLLYLYFSYMMEKDSKGSPVRIYGMTRDITKEKISAEEYEREENFISIGDAPGYIAKGHYNLTQNKVLEYWRLWDNALNVNENMTYDEIVSRAMDYVANDDDREMCKELFDRQELLFKFNSGEDRVSAEYQRAGFDVNAATWVIMELRMFRGPVSGDVECFIYMYDVTERHIRQQAAANLQEIGYVFVGIIDSVSKKATYYKLNDINGNMDVCINTDDFDSALYAEMERRSSGSEIDKMKAAVSLKRIKEELQDKPNYSYMHSIKSLKGDFMRIRSTFRYMDDERRLIYHSVRDITKEYLEEQKQMERLNEALQAADRANELKSQFLANVSHDMRTPLNAVLGYDRLAMESEDINVKNEYLDKIAMAGDTLLALINDTLDLQKIESDSVELKLEPKRCSDIVDGIVTAVKPLMDEKNIEFVLQRDKAVMATVNIDSMRIQKIFINLLSNAAKFTHEGGRVELIIECISEENGYIHDKVIVRDNGIGMSDKFITRAFEPFSQERTEETANIGGTGLGLSIVKSLVEKMGGSIELKSKLGKGSEFTVCLDLERLPDSDEITDRDESAINPQDFKGLKALLVEDNEMNMEIAESMLTAKGIHVDKATNGKTGMDLFIGSKPGTYDIILMDVRMPVMDGYLATRNIRRSSHPEALTVPIIAMTADAYENDVERSQLMGMNAHLAKPIDPDKLFKTIALLVKKTGDVK